MRMTYKYYDQPRLPKDKIFVFGSNLAGRHGKGTARAAFLYYGAAYWHGSGLMKECYAIPTKDRDLKVLPLHDIVPYIHAFVLFTQKHPELQFYVTPVGTGLAGLAPEDIAPHFKGAVNCEFPQFFQQYLESGL